MLPDVQPLVHLQRLQRLSLCHAGEAPGVLALTPHADFPGLTALHLEAGQPSWNGNTPLVRCVARLLVHHVPRIAQQTLKVSLGLRVVQMAVGEALLVCCEYAPVEFEWAFGRFHWGWVPEAEPDELMLRIRGLRGLHSLEQLLDALLPPDSPLYHLVLRDSQLPHAAILAAGALLCALAGR